MIMYYLDPCESTMKVPLCFIHTTWLINIQKHDARKDKFSDSTMAIRVNAFRICQNS